MCFQEHSQHTDDEESLCLHAGVKKEGRGSSIIKVRSPKLNTAEECRPSIKSTLTLITKAPAGMIREWRGVCRQDFG
jgi:hypothetical protein